jgi:hypothetical protein
MYSDPTGHTYIPFNGIILDTSNGNVSSSVQTWTPTDMSPIKFVNGTTLNTSTGYVSSSIQTSTTTKTKPTPMPKPIPVPTPTKAAPLAGGKSTTDPNDFQVTGNRQISYNGQNYSIYVPTFNNNTNSSIDGDGWESLKPIEGSDWSFDITGIVGQFFGTFGNNTDTIVAENSVNEADQGRYIDKDGSNRNLYVGYSNGKITNGVGLGIEFVSDVIKSIGGNSNKTMIKIVLQKNGNDRRVIIMVGNPKSATSCKQGTTYMIPSGTQIGAAAMSKSIGSELKDMGYGKYVESGLFTQTNIKYTISEEHKDNPYTGYISFDSKGNLALTPIVYKDDKVQIVSQLNLDGFTCNEKIKYTFDNELASGSAIIPSAYVGNINDVFGKLNVTIVR